jgi:hypothetical protein
VPAGAADLLALEHDKYTSPLLKPLTSRNEDLKFFETDLDLNDSRSSTFSMPAPDFTDCTNGIGEPRPV